MAQQTTVIYHKNCFDGFAAAWVLWVRTKAQREQGHIVTFIPAQYGEDPPTLEPEGQTVYLVDFSYPREVLEALAAKHTLIVLDHHKSAKEALEGLPYCTFDIERSGAGMTWDHCFPGQPRPSLINYIEDRDLWRFALHHSREANACLSSYSKDFEFWCDIADWFEDDFHTVVGEGKTILRYERVKVNEICEQAMMAVLEPDKPAVPAVNCPYNLGSAVCERLLELHPSAAYTAYYFNRADGKQQWGLRSRGYDVSEVAKQYGGGGHVRAAGFELE